jgi:acid phosphatase (class A)
MRKFVVPGLVALSLALAPAALFAREAVFAPPEQTEALLILPDPPVDGSEAHKADLAILHELEATRTPQQQEAAREDAIAQNIFRFKSVFGDQFTEANLPLTAALGNKLLAEAGDNAGAAKHLFHRKRPYNADPTLHPVCPTTPKDDSYPSGHSTAGWLLGLTLVEMVPEQREAILVRAADYARNRLVCGMHYPTDIEAGRALAYAVHGALAQNPAYRSELAAAKAELRKALNLPDAQ